MAISFPVRLPDDCAASERKTHNALLNLSDDWRVFHSVVWQGIRWGKQADGEADFVLIHRTVGLIVLEVKGGRIEIVDGHWFSIDRDGARHGIRNPFLQASDSKHSLDRYL